MYPPINGTELGNSLPYAFIYANDVTSGWFGVFMVMGFFLTVFISSLIIQFKFTSRIRPEHSLLAGTFSTLGFAVLIEQYSGILNATYFFLIIGATILSFIWVVTSGEG